MAVDPSLMQAYAQYGQALGGAQAATDPFSQYGTMLTQMGNQWIKEKEEDKRKFQNYTKKHDAIMQKMPGVSHLKGANQEIFSNKIFELVEQGDLALQNGDKAGYQQVMQSLQQIQGEMSKFEGLYEAAKGDLSAASGTAGLNKIFNEDGQYEIMFGEDLSLQIKTATENGVVDTEYRGVDWYQDRLTPNAAEGLTNAADLGMDQILSKAKKYEQFSFDDHTKDWNKIINKMTQDDDILLSLVHDNALALTDENGDPITIAEKLAQGGISTDWMYEYNRDKTVEEGGYDINRLRAETKKVLEDYFREDFGDKIEAMKPKSDKDSGKNKYGDWDEYSWTTKGTKDDEGKHITHIDATKRRSSLDNFEDIGGAHGYYTWDKDQNLYVRDDGKTYDLYQVADIEGLIKTGESRNNFNVKLKQGGNLEAEYAAKGGATPSMLKEVKGDDDASDKLNEKFGFSYKNALDDPEASRYYFIPYTGGDWFDSKKHHSDNVWSDDIMLIDRETGQPVMDGKKPRRFGTGEDFKTSDLDWINEYLKDYIRKFDPNKY